MELIRMSEEEQEAIEHNKKYVSITFDKDAEAETIEKLAMVSRISGLSMKQILISGLSSNEVKKVYNQKLQLIQDI